MLAIAIRLFIYKSLIIDYIERLLALSEYLVSDIVSTSSTISSWCSSIRNSSRSSSTSSVSQWGGFKFQLFFSDDCNERRLRYPIGRKKGATGGGARGQGDEEREESRERENKTEYEKEREKEKKKFYPVRRQRTFSISSNRLLVSLRRPSFLPSTRTP